MSKLKKILAAVFGGLILLVVAVSVASTDGNATDRLITFVQMCVFLVVPYLFIFDFGGFRARLPLFRDKKTGRTVVGFCLFAVVWMIACGLVIGIGENHHSEEYLATQQAKRQLRREAQAVAAAERAAATEAKRAAAEAKRVAAEAEREARRNAEREAAAERKIANEHLTH